MKQLKYIILCFALGLMVSLQAQEGMKQIREVSIINDSAKIIADIWMPEYSPKKLHTELTYAWYYRQAIHYTQGDCSGQVLHGAYKHFSKTGKLLAKGHYKKGLRTGTWKYWDKNGVLLQTIDYEDGRTNGSQKLFYPNGELKESRSFKNGMLHGPTEKYLKGERVSRTQYRNGKVRHVSYYENGKKKKAENLKRKKKDEMAEARPEEETGQKEKKHRFRSLWQWMKGIAHKKNKQEDGKGES